MLQTLPIVISQVKPGKTSENLLSEIWGIIYSFYQENEITKSVLSNIRDSTGIIKSGYYIYEFCK